MSKISFVTEYWDWLKKKGYKPEDAERRELLSEFYYSEFHHNHPKYEVNGVEYFQALGKYKSEVKNESICSAHSIYTNR